MKLLLGLVLLALMLSGCASHIEPTTCPAPDGQLLVAPLNLSKLQAGPMSEGDAVTAWLNDTELFRVQRSNFIALQSHGFDQCKWPRPAAAGK